MSMKQAVARRKVNEASYQTSRFNALKHGVLSKHTVLPWEDQGEYDALHASLVEEHAPTGPTEAHLVEELAGVMWRKARLRLAETAAFRQRLRQTLDQIDAHVQGNPSAAAAFACVGGEAPKGTAVAREAVQSTTAEANDKVKVAAIAARCASTALRLLGDGKAKSYERALEALRPAIREWWQQTLQGRAQEPELVYRAPDVTLQQYLASGASETKYEAGARSLAEWLEREALPHYRQQFAATTNRNAIREQAFGDAFDPARMDNLARYETHLDRKLERTLAVLVKLQELRRERKTDGD